MPPAFLISVIIPCIRDKLNLASISISRTPFDAGGKQLKGLRKFSAACEYSVHLQSRLSDESRIWPVVTCLSGHESRPAELYALYSLPHLSLLRGSQLVWSLFTVKRASRLLPTRKKTVWGLSEQHFPPSRRDCKTQSSVGSVARHSFLIVWFPFEIWRNRYCFPVC